MNKDKRIAELERQVEEAMKDARIKELEEELARLHMGIIPTCNHYPLFPPSNCPDTWRQNAHVSRYNAIANCVS